MGVVRGLVKLKKIQKSQKNSVWPDNTHPPPYPIFICFWKHVQPQKKTKKKNFSDFWIFFNLTKPLSMALTRKLINCSFLYLVIFFVIFRHLKLLQIMKKNSTYEKNSVTWLTEMLYQIQCHFIWCETCFKAYIYTGVAGQGSTLTTLKY